MSNEKKGPWLFQFYREWNPTQLNGDSNIGMGEFFTKHVKKWGNNTNRVVYLIKKSLERLWGAETSWQFKFRRGLHAPCKDSCQ